MHRLNARVKALETAYQRGRDERIATICNYLLAHLTPAQLHAFCGALQRNLADGENASYTQEEEAASQRVNELIAHSPGIAMMFRELCTGGRECTG